MRHTANRLYTVGYLAPGVGLLTLFIVIPILLTAWVSLHNWNMLTPFGQMQYTGLQNYKDLFSNSVFLKALGNTFFYTLASVIIVLPLSVLLGIFLYNTSAKGKSFARTVLFLPYVIPNVAVAIVWGYLYSPLYGPINLVLSWFHIPSQPWLGSIHEALWALIILNVWQTTGYYTVIVMAGLTEIPRDYYEAAAIDGASSFRILQKITLPLLKRSLSFIVVILTMNTLQIFDPVYILTQGGPVNATNTVVYNMYRSAFNFLDMGHSSAMVFVLFIAVLIFSFIELRLLQSAD